MNEEILEKIKGGLIVSCQALPSEPLYSSYIMSAMANAAYLGGAVGIRANTRKDIKSIKSIVDLPVIGIVKKDYSKSDIYITPTYREVKQLVDVNSEIIAVDATDRLRPKGLCLDKFFAHIRKKYPNQLFMADCSTYEEAVHAQEIGFDLVGTTLCGYTPYTSGTDLPNLELIKKLSENLTVPVVAEGGISTPEDAKKALEAGAYCLVVGGAITRPMEITKRFVEKIKVD